MRILATALATMALTVLPAQAGTSTSGAAPQQTKPDTDAVPLNEGQATSTPSAERAAVDSQKPTEQTSIHTIAPAEPKPDRSAQTKSTEHDSSPAES